MTGSRSTGNGGVYYYYHCQRKLGCHNTFKADEANSFFEEYLKNLQIAPEIIELYNRILEHHFLDHTSEVEQHRVLLEKQIKELDNKIETVNNKFIDGILRDDEFRLFKTRYELQRGDLVMQHATLKRMPSEYSKYLKFGLSLVGNMADFYIKADVDTKKKIVGSIFPEKLQFKNKSYRTSKINSVLELIMATVEGLNKKQVSSKANLSTLAPPSGLEPEPPD